MPDLVPDVVPPDVVPPVNAPVMTRSLSRTGLGEASARSGTTTRRSTAGAARMYATSSGSRRTSPAQRSCVSSRITAPRAHPGLRERGHRPVTRAEAEAALDGRGTWRPGPRGGALRRAGGSSIRWGRGGAGPGQRAQDIRFRRPIPLECTEPAPRGGLPRGRHSPQGEGRASLLRSSRGSRRRRMAEDLCLPDDDLALARVVNAPPRGIGDVAMERLGNWAAQMGCARCLGTAPRRPGAGHSPRRAGQAGATRRRPRPVPGTVWPR